MVNLTAKHSKPPAIAQKKAVRGNRLKGKIIHKHKIKPIVKDLIVSKPFVVSFQAVRKPFQD